MVHAHPDPESFGAALRDAAIRGLEAAGHAVTLLDLDAENYQPCPTRSDLVASDPVVRHHIDLVAAADVLVFVYPTFWSGLPAVLKGWIDRTMPPDTDVADAMGTRERAELSRIRGIVGLTTYGSPRSYRWLVGDGGRRTLRRLRWTAGLRCRFRWLALDSLDGRTDAERAAFIVDVEHAMATLSLVSR